mmetsp:Transcript_4907/g.14707  ORF Transcript_4907/g.14707 Transcript_4907/m.14707 type:complete len:339 (-) Transcript_4907:255-1271(-)
MKQLEVLQLDVALLLSRPLLESRHARIRGSPEVHDDVRYQVWQSREDWIEPLVVQGDFHVVQVVVVLEGADKDLPVGEDAPLEDSDLVWVVHHALAVLQEPGDESVALERVRVSMRVLVKFPEEVVFRVSGDVLPLVHGLGHGDDIAVQPLDLAHQAEEGGLSDSYVSLDGDAGAGLVDWQAARAAARGVQGGARHPKHAGWGLHSDSAPSWLGCREEGPAHALLRVRTVVRVPPHGQVRLAKVGMVLLANSETSHHVLLADSRVALWTRKPVDVNAVVVVRVVQIKVLYVCRHFASIYHLLLLLPLVQLFRRSRTSAASHVPRRSSSSDLTTRVSVP